MDFTSYKVAKPEFQSLVEGEQIVRLLRVEALNSFQQYNGEAKDSLPEWANATPQLAITVVAAEDGKNGGLTHRFNGCGYRKYSELSEKELKSGKYENISGYACYKDDDGDLVREEDAIRTKSCENIVNQFAAALHIKEGADLMDALQEAIQDQVRFRATVVNEPYEGKDQMRISRFKAVASTVTAEAEFED